MFIRPTRRPVPLLLALRRVALLGLVVGALGFASQRLSHAYVSLEIGCLSLDIYHKAPIGPFYGQVAVAGVTLKPDSEYFLSGQSPWWGLAASSVRVGSPAGASHPPTPTS